MLRSIESSILVAAATVLALTVPAPTAWALPAFRGAEGFGASITGGRGGAVIEVTTLAADGPGSLQAALDTPGPRIIVFTVSGVIETDIIEIPHGDVTIAGQTAPGAGITIDGRLFAAYDESVQNIIVRHVRVRPTQPSGPGEQFDALQFSLASRVLLDHVSVAFGIDETIDLYSARDVTVQWSSIESSATQGHPEGEHNYGLINGPEGARASIHHNLFAHHRNRCPALAVGPAEVRGNVVYNVRHGFVHHNPASGPFAITGNSYLAGGDDELIPFFFDDENGGADPELSYFLADNYIDDPGVFTGVVDDPWAEPFAHPSFEYLGLDASYRAEADLDLAGFPDHVAVTEEGSEVTRQQVLDCAGAWPRDVVTLRSVSDAIDGTGMWGSNVPPDLMEGLVPGTPPVDEDHDGMPDAWESDHGLDPADGSDHTTPLEDGYTAIEVYLEERAAELVGDACPSAGPGPGPDDTGGSDSGGADTAGSEGVDDTAGPGSGSVSGAATEGGGGATVGSADGSAGSSGTGGGSGATDEGGSGCGCRSSGRGSSLALALPLLVAGLRRRRR
jgi:pectate lyase